MAAKPMSKKIEKRVERSRKAVEKGAKAVEKSAKAVEKRARAVEKKVKKRLKPDDRTSPAKVAGVAAAGVAGIAGLAAALHYLRRDSEGRATLHVIADESDWLITSDGKNEPIGTFRTKEEAVEAAREAAQKAAPSELVIHRLDGSVMRSHSYESE